MQKYKTLYEILDENFVIRDHWNYSFNHLTAEIHKRSELLDKNFSTTTEIMKILKSHNTKRFIHLGPGFREANIAIALYSANGTVNKIIPDMFSDNLPDINGDGKGTAPYLLPSITSDYIEGNSPICAFKVKTYPYLKPGNVTMSDIEKFKKNLAKYGLEIKEHDAHPRNIHRLPDKAGTMVCIDADMLDVFDKDLFMSQKDEVNRWKEYVEDIYPIYKTPEIIPELQKDFGKKISLHDKTAKQKSFEKPDLGKYTAEENRRPKDFWSFLRK